MDVTCYLPDNIGARAKAAALPVSRLLRDAVISELERMDAMTEALTEVRVYEIDLVDSNGREYIGRITGTLIAYDGEQQIGVYLTDDRRVLAYSEDAREYYDVTDAPVEALGNLMRDEDAYADALAALGEKAVRDI